MEVVIKLSDKKQSSITVVHSKNRAVKTFLSPETSSKVLSKILEVEEILNANNPR